MTFIAPSRIQYKSVIALCLFFMCQNGAAENTISMTGIGGDLVTPNAQIASPNAFVYQRNNFMESRFDPVYTDDNGGNHVFTLGMYKRLELGGRLTNFDQVDARSNNSLVKPGKRDLSGNLKFNVWQNNRLWLSLGAVDFGGLAQNFTSIYGVGSYQFNQWLLSAGAASGDNDSFDGVFASVRFTPNPYISLTAELDTLQNANIGLLGRVPITQNFALQGTAAYIENNARIGLGLSYTLTRKTLPQYTLTTKPDAKETSIEEKGAATAQALSNDGFSNVRVSVYDNDRIGIALENNRYTHTDGDAIQQVRRVTSHYFPNFATTDVTLLHRGIAKFKTEIQNNTDNTVVRYAPSSGPAEADRLWRSDPQTHRQKRSIAYIYIEPRLTTAVGTEIGLIDYSLAARAGARVPLWKGAEADFSAVIPVANSENFEDGMPFSFFAQSEGLDRALIRQYIPVNRQWHTQLETGLMRVRAFDYLAFKLEGLWQLPNLPVQLHTRASRYSLLNESQSVQRDVILGTLSYSWVPYQTRLSATYGQYFYQDRGITLHYTRLFGDVFASLFAKFVDTDDISGGLEMSLPIGPRKSWRWKGVTFNGVNRWSQTIQTTISYPNTDDNRLRPGILFEPLKENDLPHRVFDSGRLFHNSIYRADSVY